MRSPTRLLVMFGLLIGAITPVAAQQRDPAAICGPIYVGAERAEFSEIAWRELQDKQLSDLCRDTIKSDEDARARGFNAGATVEGVPLEFAWSDDQNKKNNFREKFCQRSFKHVENRSYHEIAQRGASPDTNLRYLDCVRAVLEADARKPLICILKNTADPLLVHLDVIYAEFRGGVPSPIIDKAYVFNGRLGAPSPSAAALEAAATKAGTSSDVLRQVIETTRYGNNPPLFAAALEELMVDNSLAIRRRVDPEAAKADSVLPIEGGPLLPGTQGFTIWRHTVTDVVKIDIATNQGISCSATAAPNDPIEVSFEIWPVGREVDNLDKVVSGGHMGGCDENSTITQNFCLDQAEASLTGWAPTVVSSNCPAGASRLSSVVPVPGSKRCVQATYHVVGCGFNWFKNCKGRGWLDYQIALTGRKPGEAARFVKLEGRRSYPDLSTASIHYDQPIPANTEITGWRYRAEIKYLDIVDGRVQPRRIELSEANPDEGLFSTYLSTEDNSATLVLQRASDAERAASARGGGALEVRRNAMQYLANETRAIYRNQTWWTTPGRRDMYLMRPGEAWDLFGGRWSATNNPFADIPSLREDVAPRINILTNGLMRERLK